MRLKECGDRSGYERLLQPRSCTNILFPEKPLLPSRWRTFLHVLVIQSHVEHRRGVVAQNFPASPVLLVTCSYLVCALVRPPQLVSYRQETSWKQIHHLGWMFGCIYSHPENALTGVWKCSSSPMMAKAVALDNFALHSIQNLQIGAVHLTAIDCAVPGADPVQLLILEVDRQSWKEQTHQKRQQTAWK